MTLARKRYREAAIAYLVYGILYLSGALFLAATGASQRAMGAGSVWWFALGAVMVIGLPALIWREFKWVTRGLAVLVLVRVMGLLRLIARGEWEPLATPWGGSISRAYFAVGFLVVSAVTCILLTRAGWGGWLDRRRSERRAQSLSE